MELAKVIAAENAAARIRCSLSAVISKPLETEFNDALQIVAEARQLAVMFADIDKGFGLSPQEAADCREEAITRFVRFITHR